MRLAVEVGEVSGEHTVHLSVFDPLHSRFRGRIRDGFKVDMRVSDAVGGDGKVIFQRSRELARLFILGAEREIVVLIAHAHRSVLGEPLFSSEVRR